MKLIIDMNLSPLWVKFFAASGFGSIHWSKIGDPGAPDCAIMDYAAANGFVIFTHDLDFGVPLADRKSRQPSVIQIRTQDVLPAAIGLIVVRPECEPAATRGRRPGYGRSRAEQDSVVAI